MKCRSNGTEKSRGARMQRAREVLGGIFEAVVGLPVYIVLAVVALPAAAIGALSRLASRRAAAA